MLKDIAKLFNVTKTTIGYIITGHTWKHVKLNGSDQIKLDILRSKNRWSNQGSRNSRAKLNEDNVRDIKIMLRDGMNKHAIAPLFGVSVAVIKQIKYNKNWQHITI